MHYRDTEYWMDRVVLTDGCSQFWDKCPLGKAGMGTIAVRVPEAKVTSKYDCGGEVGVVEDLYG
jgi:hypothetical protein